MGSVSNVTIRADVAAALSPASAWSLSATFAEVSEHWLRANARRANTRTWASRLERVILPVLGPVMVSSVTARALPGIVDLLSLELVRVNQHAVAPRTLRAVVRQTSSITSYAVRVGAAASNPWLGFRLSEFVPDCDADLSWRAGARFTGAEVAALLADKTVPRWWRAYLHGAAYFGQRHSQTVALTWGDCAGGTVLVSRAWSTQLRELRTPKVRVSHEIPIHTAMTAFLLGWRSHWAMEFGRAPGAGDLLFPGTGRRGEPVYLRSDRALRTLKEQIKSLGMRSRGLSLHAFRRTFVTELRAAGADRDIVRRFAHARAVDTTDLYNAPPAHLRAATIALLHYA